jgi:hypothetical protein
MTAAGDYDEALTQLMTAPDHTHPTAKAASLLSTLTSL